MPQGRSACSRVGSWSGAGPELSCFPSAGRALGTLQPLPRVLRAARCPVGTGEGRGTVGTRNLFLCRLHIALKHLNFTLSKGPVVTFTSGQLWALKFQHQENEHDFSKLIVTFGHLAGKLGKLF